MVEFSDDKDKNVNIGELVFEALLSSSIELIADLDLNNNSSWFQNPDTGEEISGNVELLMELITKQTGLQTIYLYGNRFSDAAEEKIRTRIAAHPNTSLESDI